MTIEHSIITDPNIHEPKGISTAAVDAVYHADGAGSGTWIPHSYGEMYITAGAGVIALPAASAYTRVDTAGTIWTAGVGNSVTSNIATGEFTIVDAGAYNLSMWIVFTTAALAAGTRYNFRYAINGTTSTRTIATIKQTAGIDTLDTSATGMADFIVGDVVSLYVGGDGTSSGTNITILEAGFSLHRL